MLRGKPFQVQSFADLDEFFRAIFDFMEVLGKGGEVWKTHHLATIRKVRNRLSNISTRSKGLVTDDGAAHDLPWGAFEDRSVHVVDVAGTRSAGAGSGVRADRVQAARAPRAARSGGRPRRGVRGRAEQVRPGRRAGHLRAERCCSISPSAADISGWCCSPPSSSAPRCSVGWWATPAPACTGAWTWTSWPRPAYATLSPATKIKLATLPKGELMLRHPHFTQPIFVRFPAAGRARQPRGDRAVSARRASCPSPMRWRASSAASTGGCPPMRFVP